MVTCPTEEHFSSASQLRTYSDGSLRVNQFGVFNGERQLLSALKIEGGLQSEWCERNCFLVIKGEEFKTRRLMNKSPSERLHETARFPSSLEPKKCQ